MNRKKGIIFIFLLILTAAFIAFVAIMQHNFMNPDFLRNDDSNRTTSINSNNDASDHSNDDNDIEDIEETSEENDDEDEVSYSIRYVTADLLNARSGPGTDYEIVGMVTLDQEVEVEDDGSEWVKITTENFTGYVNVNYLREEE